MDRTTCTEPPGFRYLWGSGRVNLAPFFQKCKPFGAKNDHLVACKSLKQLSHNYPNFLKKDLEKFTDIILNEIKRSLRRGDGVELRNFGTFRVKTQKASIRRNPKTGEKVAVPEKKVISWKMSKEMFKKINNEE